MRGQLIVMILSTTIIAIIMITMIGTIGPRTIMSVVAIAEDRAPSPVPLASAAARVPSGTSADVRVNFYAVMPTFGISVLILTPRRHLDIVVSFNIQ